MIQKVKLKHKQMLKPHMQIFNLQVLPNFTHTNHLDDNLGKYTNLPHCDYSNIQIYFLNDTFNITIMFD